MQDNQNGEQPTTTPATTVTPTPPETPVETKKPDVPKGMTRLVAVRPVEYHKRVYVPGEEFNAKESDVAYLTKEISGGYRFSGERFGEDAKERHIIQRAKKVV